MIDLEVPVEGVALDALDAFLSSDRSPPDSAALIFDSEPRVIAKTPLDDPQAASPPTVASSAQNRHAAISMVERERPPIGGRSVTYWRLAVRPPFVPSPAAKRIQRSCRSRSCAAWPPREPREPGD